MGIKNETRLREEASYQNQDVVAPVSLKFMMEAAKRGNDLVLYALGLLYLHGFEPYLPQNLGEAIKCFKGASKKRTDALNHLGFMYFHGTGVDKNPETGLEYFKKAADKGHKEAQFNVAVIYHFGCGVNPDLVTARDFYELAAADRDDEPGYKKAQYNLGLMYYHGDGVKRHPGTAARYFKKAANQNDALSQYSLGVLYGLGDDGVDQNFDDAHKCYKQAADQGLVEAQYKLALMYVLGYGGYTDYVAARKHSKLAADKGLVGAQLLLGELYACAYGGEKDYEEACKYFKLAADQGSEDAKQSFLLLTSMGYGIKTDEDIRHEYDVIIEEKIDEIINKSSTASWAVKDYLEGTSKFMSKEQKPALSAISLTSLWRRVEEISAVSVQGRPRKDQGDYQPRKHVKVRFEPDLIDWLKSKGPNYSTRLNSLLRTLKEAEELNADSGPQ